MSKDRTYHRISGSERLSRNNEGMVIGLRSWTTRSSAQRVLCVFKVSKEQRQSTLLVPAQLTTVPRWTKDEIWQSNSSGRDNSSGIASIKGGCGKRWESDRSRYIGYYGTVIRTPVYLGQEAGYYCMKRYCVGGKGAVCQIDIREFPMVGREEDSIVGVI